MTDNAEKISRRDQILQALAHMLENNPGARITTANLAKAVGEMLHPCCGVPDT